MPTTPAPLASEIQALVAAYKLLDLELSASSYAIDHWYRQLSLLNQPDRCPEGTPDQLHAVEKRRQIDAAYQLIRTAPLRDHPLAKAAAAREEDRVRDPGLAIDRPVSVATETVARLALGVAIGLFFAYQLHLRGVPGFKIYVWLAPLVVGIYLMSSIESTGLIAFVRRL